MSEMAPEGLPEEVGEPLDVEIKYTWEGSMLEVEASLGAAKVAVWLDWRGERNPSPDLEVLLSALPQALIQVHQHIDDQEAQRG